MPTRPGRAVRIWYASDRLKRRSASVDAVAARFERGRDVFHAERLDAEKRAEAEPLVARNGTQQQDVHVRSFGSVNVAYPSPLSPWPPSSPRSSRAAYRRRADRGRRRRGRAAGLSSKARAACRSTPTSCRCCRATAASSRRSGHSSRASAASISCTSSSPRRRATRSPTTATRSTTGWTALRSAPEIARVDAGVVDRTRDFGWLADRQLLLLHGGSLDEALRRLTPEGMRAAVAARRELLDVPSPEVADLVRQDPAGLFDLAARRARRRAGGLQRRHQRRRLRDAGWPQPPGHRAAEASALRRRFSRALDARLRAIEQAIGARRQSTSRRRTTSRGRRCSVQFAGGHRIAVETEAVVRRESILNTVGSLALILPLLFIVFRSLWLVAVGSLPSALSLRRRPRRARVHRRHAVGRRHRLGGDAVRPRRRRRRAALRRASPGAWPSAPHDATCRRRSPGRRAACCSACGRRPRRSTA